MENSVSGIISLESYVQCFSYFFMFSFSSSISLVISFSVDRIFTHCVEISKIEKEITI